MISSGVKYYILITSVLLLTAGLSVPGLLSADRLEIDEGTRLYNAPVWNTGDWWKYYHYDDMDTTLNSQGIVITIDEETTIQTMVVESEESVTVNGTSYDIYNVSISGHTAQRGTASFMGNSGDYQDNSQVTGYAYYRRSDLAYVKEVLHNTGKITITILGETVEENHEDVIISTAEPAREDFKFPMSAATTWNVNSVVTINQTITSMGETQSDEYRMIYNFGATVELEKTEEVLGEDMDFHPVHYVGTITIDGIPAVLNTYNNYSAEVKNSIEGLLGYGDAANPPGSGDLEVSQSSFALHPSTPRENTPFNITCNVSNKGTGKVVGVRVNASLDGDYLGKERMISFIDPGEYVSLNYSIDALSAGSYDLDIILDPDNYVEETNEDNNDFTYTFQIYQNQAPVIQAPIPFFDHIVVNVDAEVGFHVDVMEPEGDEVEFLWKVDGQVVYGAHTSDLQHTFSDADGGDVIIVAVNATDPFGAADSFQWTVTINTAPTITGHTPQDVEFTVNETETAQISITYENLGDNNVRLEWYLNGVLIPGKVTTMFDFPTSFDGDNSSADSPYDIRVVVTDALNLSDSMDFRVHVTNVNRAPEIINTFMNGTSAQEYTINESESLSIEAIASDPDSDDLSYTWYLDGEVLQGETGSEFVLATDYDTVDHTGTKKVRDFQVIVNISDGADAITAEWTVKVRDVNRGLSITDIGPEENELKEIMEDEKINFSVTAVDEDGDNVTYTWYLDGNMLTVDREFSYKFTKAGNFTIKVVAEDGFGFTDEKYLELSVVGDDPVVSGDDDTGSDDDSSGGSSGGSLIWIMIFLVVIIVIIVVIIVLKGKKKKGSGEDEPPKNVEFQQ